MRPTLGTQYARSARGRTWTFTRARMSPELGRSVYRQPSLCAFDKPRKTDGAPQTATCKLTRNSQTATCKLTRNSQTATCKLTRNSQTATCKLTRNSQHNGSRNSTGEAALDWREPHPGWASNDIQTTDIATIRMQDPMDTPNTPVHAHKGRPPLPLGEGVC